MGTRGFYVYKWRGRYYVYYNHWDSYPSGLGKVLVSTIPTDPEEFRQWLENKRIEYTELERRVFTVSLPSARAAKLHEPSEVGVQRLFERPSYERRQDNGQVSQIQPKETTVINPIHVV